MSATLTPLPSPRSGIPAQIVGPRTWNILPFPVASPVSDPSPHAPALPPWPENRPPTSPAVFPASWPSPLAVMPSAPAQELPVHPLPEISSLPGFPPPAPKDRETPPRPPTPATPPAKPHDPDFTDEDLRDALGPIVEQAVRRSVYAHENGIDTYLEPMLRATIRRALAEYAPASRPFQPPGAFDRFVWHVKALFTSRTYEDILFEKTRRFQIEEVYLLDANTLAMVSFASCDPARHASARRVSGTAQRLALQLPDEHGEIRRSVELSDQRWLVSRKGRFVILMALVRGRPGELVSVDLEFALKRIEDHFRDQFQQQGSALLHELQPFLEDCLLIQAPASAA